MCVRACVVVVPSNLDASLTPCGIYGLINRGWSHRTKLFNYLVGGDGGRLQRRSPPLLLATKYLLLHCSGFVNILDYCCTELVFANPIDADKNIRNIYIYSLPHSPLTVLLRLLFVCACVFFSAGGGGFDAARVWFGSYFSGREKKLTSLSPAGCTVTCDIPATSAGSGGVWARR